MKEELKSEFEILQSKLEEINIVELHSDDRYGNVFRSVLLGSYIKCIEFNYYIVNKEKQGSFYLLSSLRSMVEELIALKFIIEKFNGDKNELMITYSNKNCFDGILAQEKFFKEIGSEQPIMNTHLATVELKNSLDKMKKIWESEGQRKERSFPTVAQMATDGKLVKLYNYLYAASSSHVHFNPHVLIRMGWTENMNENPIRHKISTNNFDSYYEDFLVYYAAYVLLEMTKAYKKELSLSKEILNVIKQVKSIVTNVKRIPELITFEEFNIKRGISFVLLGIGTEHLKKKSITIDKK